MEVPFAGMIIKVYLRLKIGGELYWPRALSSVVLAMDSAFQELTQVKCMNSEVCHEIILLEVPCTSPLTRSTCLLLCIVLARNTLIALGFANSSMVGLSLFLDLRF